MNFLISLLWNLFFYSATLIGLLSLGTMLVMQIIQFVLLFFFPRRNFKETYGDWAIVTGASSGIGAAITDNLAQQGVNVVMAALPDQMLKDKITELRAKYPSVTFRECGCNLGATDPKDYMNPIVEATRDIDVRIVFNNAAFINFGFFIDIPIEKMRANMICNASSSVEITHYFGQLFAAAQPLTRKNRRGFIGFTSSCGGYLPSPTAMLYGATKAFLSNFGVSYGAENYDLNIDTLVVLPGPVATNFYKHAVGLPTVEATKNIAVGTQSIVDCFFAGAGRVMVFEQGTLTMGFKLMTKVLDFGFLSEIFRRFAFLFPDHAECIKRSKTRNKNTTNDDSSNQKQK